MNQPSLRRFEKELRENRNKEALVIDQRWNGGGNIEQELLAILVQREYQVWQPRGTEADRPSVRRLLRAEGRAAELALGVERRDVPGRLPGLGLGKVIGTPTMGAVIGTGSYSLIDGSTVRTPGVGVFLADRKRHQHGELRRAARHPGREHARGQPRRPRPAARSRRPGAAEATGIADNDGDERVWALTGNGGYGR